MSITQIKKDKYKLESDLIATSQELLTEEAPKINPKSIAKFRNSLVAIGLAGFSTLNANIEKVSAQENPQYTIQEQPSQQQIQQVQVNQSGRNPSLNYNQPQSNGQLTPYPSQQGRPSSLPSLKVYSDFNRGEGGTNSNKITTSQNQETFKAGIEINIPLGLDAGEKITAEQTQMATLERLKRQVEELCNPKNLLLPQAKCDILKEQLFQSIQKRFQDLNK